MLMNCPECNGTVSNSAVACPHCGWPVKVETVQPSAEERPAAVPPSYRWSYRWSRFWAKWIDQVILANVLGAVLYFLLVTLDLDYNSFSYDIEGGAFYILLLILLSVSFPIVEAASIAKFKTTIGKAAFGIRVAGEDGANLNSSASQKRSWGCWISGCAAGVPVIGLAASWDAYNAIGPNGRAKWDVTNRANVQANPSAFSWLVLALVMMAQAAMNLWMRSLA